MRRRPRTWRRTYLYGSGNASKRGVSPADIPTAWVMRVTINRIRDKLRTPWHRHVSLVGDAVPTSTVASAEAQVMQAWPGPLMQEVEALPKDQRDVVNLVYIADLGIGSIAQVLRLTPNTVKTRLHRARLRLKEALARGRRTTNARR